MSGPIALLITAEDVLLDRALAVCAAAGVEPELAVDLGAARARWTSAAVVLVGADLAEQAAQLGLPRRSNVLLIDVDDSTRQLSGPSIRLGAPLVTLPSGANGLGATLLDGAGPARESRVIGVLGGSGGVGASTVAAALALSAARVGRRAMLIDLDPVGGGLDLLVGAERVPGWRWPRLVGARGQLGDLSGQLPQLDGVDLVSMARDGSPGQPPGPAALAAVVASGVRTHEQVVLDIGRGAAELTGPALGSADVGVLLVAADVRGVAAARQSFDLVGSECENWRLVVRRPRVGGLSAADVADGFPVDLIGVIDDDPALAAAAQRGMPPARSARSSLARVCRDVLDTVVAREPSPA